MALRMSFGRLAAACLAAVAADAGAAGGDPPPQGDESLLVQRFLSRDEAPLATYRARRILRAENDRFNARGQIEVVTELRPDGSLAFEIVHEDGSGYIRNKVLRKVLRDEADLRRRGDAARGGLTPANYVFSDDPAPAGGERRVLIRPRRKDVMLVDGAIVLSHDGDLVRVEGRLAKNPSFWTRRVHVVRRYARIGGVRVPVSTESVADVRFAGRSRFEMVYLYETINGRPVAHEAVPMRAAWQVETLDRSDGVPEALFEHVPVP